MNVVSLIGNLATEVELRELGGERRVATFVVAVDRPGRDGGADYVRIAAWNRQAEACNRLLGKGRRVAVDGRLRSRSWEGADGSRRTTLEVVANHIEFIERVEPAEQEAA